MRTVSVFLAAVWMSAVVRAESDPSTITKLREMSIEELFELDVSSIFKRPMKWSEAPAAAFVITQDDIRRSGATSIPELLRLVPGTTVNNTDSNKYGITIRGFSEGRFSHKLLTLFDGRNQYRAFFGGTYWEAEDYVLEDIERIEVIRGPGSALWGSNAVNGVVNIVTKSAQDTEGGYFTAIGGTEEQGTGALRYGAQISDVLSVRGYLKVYQRDDLKTTEGTDANDDTQQTRGGFRADWEYDEDRLTLQGDFFDADFGQQLVIPDAGAATTQYITRVDEEVRMQGGNLLLRWEHVIDEDRDLALQVYYDYSKREEFWITDQRQTLDLDFQHRLPLMDRHEFIYGGNLRYLPDDFTTGHATMVPDSRDRTQGDVFIHDEIEVVDDLVRLTLGAKFEENALTGLEVMPNARVAVTPAENYFLWGAVSRAVREPPRDFHDVTFTMTPTVPPLPPTVPPLPPGTAIPPGVEAVIYRHSGNKDLKSEDLLAYELGLRAKLTDRVSLDVAGYYNEESDRYSYPFGTPEVAPPFLIIPFTTDNSGDDTETHGVETVVQFQATDNWRLQGWHAWADGDFYPISDPKHQFSLRSSHDLPRNVELDLWLRYVDDFRDIVFPIPGRDVDSYYDLDLRLGWRPGDGNLELVFAAQNLFDPRRREFMDTPSFNTRVTEVQRAFYFQVTYRF